MSTPSPLRIARRLPVLVLAVALVAGLVAPLVLAGTAAPRASVGSVDASQLADATHGSRVEGVVTDVQGNPAGDAYVLVQAKGEGIIQNATDGEEPVRQSLLELTANPPFRLYWNATTEDGSYVVHVPRPADYEVVAVSEDGVSRLRTAQVRVQTGERDLTIDPDHVLSVETGTPSAAPGEVATVDVRVPNPNDEPVENLSMTFSPPRGWSILGVETPGEYDADARRVTVEQVEPGGVATATIRIQVPEGAATDLHGIAVTADARTHFVEHTTAQVRVAPQGAATPTLTPTGTDERFTFDSPSRPTDSSPTALYLLSASVFAIGAAFAGYSIWRTGLR